MTVMRTDPYTGGNFVVEVDGIAATDAVRVVLPCSEVEVVTHREGDDPGGTRKQPGHQKFESVTIERGLTGNTEFYEWWSQVRDGVADVDRSVTVTLLDEARNAVWRWRFVRAFPTAYCFSALDARTDEVVVETLVLAFDAMAVD